MKIAIIAALPQELAAVCNALGVREIPRLGELHRVTEPGNHEYLLALSGMGYDNAARCAERLVRDEAPDLLVSTGFCGALAPELCVGDVVVAREMVVSNDAGFDDVPVLLASAGQNFVVLQAVEQERVVAGTFISTARIMTKQALAARVPVHCQNAVVEMESSAIALVAVEYGIPLLAIRAVSDAAADELCFSLEEFCDRKLQQVKPLKVLLTILKRPAIIPHLLHLSRCSARAATTLESVLIRLFAYLQHSTRR